MSRPDLEGFECQPECILYLMGSCARFMALLVCACQDSKDFSASAVDPGQAECLQVTLG